MIYTAITIKNGRVTGRHESSTPMDTTMFAGTPYADQELRQVEADTEYTGGRLMAEYTDTGKLRPLIDRIREGLCPVPEEYELVDGELVPKNPTPEETPERLQATIDKLRAQIAALQKTTLGV